ncbi:hypothetical protein CAAN1_11S01002 [[Candida] anglica]|uniref:L-ornithine N(5)-monooxygenase [NAD(P)H] n=1 Tax=[Candida] anglica TaxID=148631 RepID=A0ABP0EL34_9ASCO
MTLKLDLESHEDPFKFRATYDEVNSVLNSEKFPTPDNDIVLKSQSKVTIVGGGLSGLTCAITCKNELKEDDVTIFDKYSKFGGTWFTSIYPGCACDVPAVWYSFSAELNSNWSQLTPRQYEIEEYITEVVKKLELDRHAKFRTEVVESRYNEELGEWIVHGINLDTGQRLEHKTKILVISQGGLVYPNHLKAAKLGDFEGEYLHSALWNYDVDLKGKDIVVVGNGCSASQIIPQVLEHYDPKSIVQIFRSKQYYLPPLPEVAHTVYKLFSGTRAGILFVRWFIATVAELKYPQYSGGGGFLSRLIRWLSTREAINYMERTCPSKYHDMIIPHYKIGCKGLVFDYKYLPSLHDQRISLVDIGIDHIEANHVVLASGEKLHADVIVACTGYDLNKSYSKVPIYGINGISIKELWEEEGPSAYETILIKRCPNLFVFGGPNSSPAHSSLLSGVENSCALFKKFATKILSGELKSICVKDSKYDEWNFETQRVLRNHVLGTSYGGCGSWYTGDQNRNNYSYPYSQIYYWWRMKYPKWDDFILEKN